MESWIKVNKKSGSGNDIITCTCLPNLGSSDRTGKITVFNDNKVLECIITQLKNLNMNVYLGCYNLNITPKSVGEDGIVNYEIDTSTLNTPTETGYLYCLVHKSFVPDYLPPNPELPDEYNTLCIFNWPSGADVVFSRESIIGDYILYKGTIYRYESIEGGSVDTQLEVVSSPDLTSQGIVLANLEMTY